MADRMNKMIPGTSEQTSIFSAACYVVFAKEVIHKAFEITFEEAAVLFPNNWLCSAQNVGDFKRNLN